MIKKPWTKVSPCISDLGSRHSRSHQLLRNEHVCPITPEPYGTLCEQDASVRQIQTTAVVPNPSQKSPGPRPSNACDCRVFAPVSPVSCLARFRSSCHACVNAVRVEHIECRCFHMPKATEMINTKHRVIPTRRPILACRGRYPTTLHCGRPASWGIPIRPVLVPRTHGTLPLPQKPAFELR